MNFKCENEIRNGKYLGSGTFGAVYQYGDYAIKIYHDLVKTDGGYGVKNPSLNDLKKLKLLLNKSRKIQNTDLIVDLLFINNVFKGVCYPYQDAVTLASAVEKTTFEQKQSIGYQLINNTKELNRHFIYPLDSKLDNILYSNGKIIIIDLDDVKTKVTHYFNPVLLERCLYSLKQSITSVFNGDQYLFGYDVLRLLESYKEYDNFSCNLCTSYHSLYNFISKRSVEKKLIFINPNSLSQLDLAKLKKIIEFTDSKIILTFFNNNSYIYDIEIESYIKAIKTFEQLDIPVYDIVFQKKEEIREQKIIQCLNNYNTTGYYIFDTENIFQEFIGHQYIENGDLDFCINTLNNKSYIKK